MDFEKYYQEVLIRANAGPEWRTRDYPLWYYAIGLSSEASEVADQVKKVARDSMIEAEDGPITGERRDKIVLELGDTMFYFIRFCKKAGIDPAEVFNASIVKLDSLIQGDKKWG